MEELTFSRAMAETGIPLEITGLLRRWNDGDKAALSSLTEAAYDELHAIAIGYLQRETSGITLQATELVNELYLRLARVREAELVDRHHFYTFAAKLMRAILTDYARRARAQKRPAAAARIPLHEQMAWVDAVSDEMLALDTALEELRTLDERKIQAVELRFFSAAPPKKWPSCWASRWPPPSATLRLLARGSSAGCPRRRVRSK
jgi:RNA polymerase sigma factor (TIGR02999 family)